MKPIRFAYALIITLLATTGVFAQQKEALLPAIFSPGGIALHGYDPVSYFTEEKPARGDSGISITHEGVTWHFASVGNKETFLTNPATYMPQYGGYCAFGMSRGYKAPTEADAWTIVDGKLYFNYNKKVRESWNKAPKAYIDKADQNWLTVKTAK
ncbi:YHS domain-containing (seleno)protein [Arsenicibacter rosenii]|uniref:YHS domain protein n=1 Tax=Arsenicibacter rosenii TaxID=1750698 RepID=A0A1S2VFG7_9BACT|nr:YHS domain-containing (seleno)protein [Arsenicibacter rosenii]OIN57497.1 YHS domain protein [Arsenicibacter rosenii]